jgi:hypothetical protein
VIGIPTHRAAPGSGHRSRPLLLGEHGFHSLAVSTQAVEISGSGWLTPGPGRMAQLTAFSDHGAESNATGASYHAHP